MCGIFCSISRTAHIAPSPELQERLSSRGPDSARAVLISADEAELTLSSTVLSLRGSKTVTQPYQDNYKRHTLCWNGEAWSTDGKARTGNDTEAIHQLLVASVDSANEDDMTLDQSAARVATALSRVAGPYAFVFYNASRSRLYVGRDFLGRRSLLFRTTADGDLLFSSVSSGESELEWQELPADGVYCFALDTAMVPECTTRLFGTFSAGHCPFAFSNEGHDSVGQVAVIPMSTPAHSQHLALTALSPSVSRLEELLQDSLSLRVSNIPGPPGTEDSDGSISKLAVLFSGGLDCTVLARMAHDLLPAHEPIDLLNVAFENPRIHDASLGGVSAFELCPDRITGRASFAELQEVCPGRLWRFVAINVPYVETNEHRQTVISLMHPHNTEMDLSISFALYFAARGRGGVTRTADGDIVPYITSARVLLSGLGADELFGGYTRHATAYRRGGVPGLLDELELDVGRLGQRNLGRDDRVMSHWSREVRFPFLDEDLLSWALAAPVDEKYGLENPVADSLSFSPETEGSNMLEPGKKVLRCFAWKLGMEAVAKEKKRAVSIEEGCSDMCRLLNTMQIQFGARTAKMEKRKTKGTQLLF
ncbi:uncharacterized protein LTR77_006616 [Saxophila tyrrhenica]|uniref:Glutamine amidotransferase type-2 domain-containing protein n=1 Tax=Saxophila tyrrhenica TaxID=1690608 RepID=A0AAV9P5U3_9PEZI|nr:hypothetical protein LTR77_006616 [Saxophila tyrrhenica]